MPGRLLLVLIAITVVSTKGQIRTEAFGSILTYHPPDSTTWGRPDKSYDADIGRGSIVYTREPVFDEEGRAVRPVVAIIYEKLLDTTDAVTYSMMKRVASSLKWKIRKISAPDSSEYGNSVFYEAEYELQDVKHILYIAYATQGLLGVQVIGDSTEGVVKQVESSIKMFVHSLFLSE